MRSLSIDLVVAAAFLSTATGVSAGTRSLSYQTALDVVGGFDSSKISTLEFPKFDPALGRLTSAKFDVKGESRLDVTWDIQRILIGSGLYYSVYYDGGYTSLEIDSENGPFDIPHYFPIGAPSQQYSAIVTSGEVGEIHDYRSIYGSLVINSSDDLSRLTGLGSLTAIDYSSILAYEECLSINCDYARDKFTWSATANYKYDATYTYAVPEPGTWVLMISGFAAVGIASRHRGRGRAAVATGAV